MQYYAPNPQRRTRRPVPVVRKRSSLPLKAISGFVLLAVVVGFGWHNAGASSSPNNDRQVLSTQTVPQEPVKPTISHDEMGANMQQIIAANPDLDISVSVGDPKDGSVSHYGTDAIYEAASVAKVLTGVFYLHNVETGNLKLDRPIGTTDARQYIQVMIEQSDNTAWKTLNDIVNRDRMKTYAQSIGFQHYDYTDNTFTSDDIARLLVQLQQGKLLNYEHTQLILSHMKNASRSEYISPALPPEAKLYHKAGWLEDRVHDAAIIDDGHRPYILVIFTNGHAKYHPVPREKILQQITRVTVARFISNEHLAAP